MSNIFVVNDPHTELEIARFADDARLLPNVADIVLQFVRSGCDVRWRGAEAIAQGVNPPGMRGTKAVGVPVKAAKTAKAGKVTIPGTWSPGDAVYVAKAALTGPAKEHFWKWSGKRGIVETTRRGMGIRRTIGVRFETQTPGDDVVWLAPGELSPVPPGEL